MGSNRKSGIIAGVFFVVAAITAIAGLALYHRVLHDPSYIVDGSRDDTQVLLGAFCEIVLAISVVGTATTLFPIIRPRARASHSRMWSAACWRPR